MIHWVYLVYTAYTLCRLAIRPVQFVYNVSSVIYGPMYAPNMNISEQNKTQKSIFCLTLARGFKNSIYIVYSVYNLMYSSCREKKIPANQM